MTPKSPTTIPVVYATAASPAVAPIVAQLYGFTGRVQCELVNRGFNDTYLIRTAQQGRFIFRLSQFGRREQSDIAANDLEAVHAFVMIRHYWLMGEYASRAPEWGTENMSSRWLNAQIDFLRRWEEDRLSPGLLKISARFKS